MRPEGTAVVIEEDVATSRGISAKKARHRLQYVKCLRDCEDEKDCSW
jgi:hypothetical protein